MCDLPATHRGIYCNKHYQRWLRWGDPAGRATEQGAPMAHFREHLMTEQDECKVWPYGSNGGYGMLWVDGAHRRVHALACEAWHGPRPDGMQACHGPCHNTLCWNGAHLSWGSPGRNQLHRHRDGTTEHFKLTAEDVMLIRAAWPAETMTAIAERFGVSRRQISNIVNGKQWNWVVPIKPLQDLAAGAPSP